MRLERIVINKKRNNDEIIRDKIFYSLVQVMVNDYFRIQEKYGKGNFQEIGKEFSDLHGALLVLDPDEKEIKDYCDKIEYFEPISIWEKNFIEKLEKNLEGDGARIIRANSLRFEAGIYAHVEAKRKKKMSITGLIKKYTAHKEGFAGERLTASLAFSIATKKHTYIISKTTQHTQNQVIMEGKNYTEIGTGKVAEFGPKGLVRDVKLENGNDDIPKNHCLKKDVYIEQSSYRYYSGIQLASMNYLTLEDIEILLLQKVSTGPSFKKKMINFFTSRSKNK